MCIYIIIPLLIGLRLLDELFVVFPLRERDLSREFDEIDDEFDCITFLIFLSLSVSLSLLFDDILSLLSFLNEL